MFIRSINNVVGYKDLPDGFNVEFDENKTYIVGGNFQRKTTVGSLFNWCLTGTSLDGKEKENVANDTKKVSNVIVDINFVDNFGIEHRLIRDKSKEVHLTLDGREIKQESLAEFYKDKDIFLVAHNPYYFWTLEPKEQKDLIRSILPAISPNEAFEMLSNDEQKLLGQPIENLSSYTDKKNEIINGLEKEYNINIGKIEALKNIAIKEEGEIMQFGKEQELNGLLEKYEKISNSLGNSNLDDLQQSINTLDKRLKELINNDLTDLSERYKREKNKLLEVDKEEPVCPSCRQVIKNSESKEYLRKAFQKEMNRLQEKANSLKIRAEELSIAKKEKQDLYNRLNTEDMKKIQKEKDILKRKIDLLKGEKNRYNSS